MKKYPHSIRCPYCGNIFSKKIKAKTLEESDKIFWTKYEKEHGKGKCS